MTENLTVEAYQKLSLAEQVGYHIQRQRIHTLSFEIHADGTEIQRPIDSFRIRDGVIELYWNPDKLDMSPLNIERRILRFQRGYVQKSYRDTLRRSRRWVEKPEYSGIVYVGIAPGPSLRPPSRCETMSGFVER